MFWVIQNISGSWSWQNKIQSIFDTKSKQYTLNSTETRKVDTCRKKLLKIIWLKILWTVLKQGRLIRVEKSYLNYLVKNTTRSRANRNWAQIKPLKTRCSYKKFLLPILILVWFRKSYLYLRKLNFFWNMDKKKSSRIQGLLHGRHFISRYFPAFGVK